MNYKFLIILLFCFALIPQLSLATNGNFCIDNKCYKWKEDVPIKITERFIESTLNLDGSISFIQEIGFTYDIKSVREEGSIVIFNLSLPYDVNFLRDIEVSELIREENLDLVYKFTAPCDGQFIFDTSKEPRISVCMESGNQIKIRFEGKILPEKTLQNHFFCGTINDVVSNSLNLAIQPVDYEYPFSVLLKGGKDISIDLQKSSCRGYSSSGEELIKLRALPDGENGVRCTGKVLPINRKVNLGLDISGINIGKVKERDKQQLEQLQKEETETSIRASKAIIVNAILTFLLVCITAFYAIQTRKTVEAMERSHEKEFRPHISRTEQKNILSFQNNHPIIETFFEFTNNSRGRVSDLSISVEISCGKDIKPKRDIVKGFSMNVGEKLDVSTGRLEFSNIKVNQEEQERIFSELTEGSSVTINDPNLKHHILMVMGLEYKNSDGDSYEDVYKYRFDLKFKRWLCRN